MPKTTRWAAFGEKVMKADIHPTLHPVVFIDASTGDEVISRSTQKSGETRAIDGVDHYVIKVDISAFSHPVYTGKQRNIDTEGRLDRFRRKYNR